MARTFQSHAKCRCGATFNCATWRKTPAGFEIIAAEPDAYGQPKRVNGKKVPAMPIHVYHRQTSACSPSDAIPSTPNTESTESKETKITMPATSVSFDGILSQIIEANLASLRGELQAMKADLEAKAGRQPVIVNLTPVKSVTVEPTDHPLLPLVAARLELAKETKLWPYLWGPPGSGKSYAGPTLAGRMKLDLHLVTLGQASLPSQLFGFMLPNGKPAETSFRRAWLNGGLLLMEEFDNTNAGLAVMIGGALQSNIASFPDGDFPRHPDCLIMANGNTPMRGGVAGHESRSKQDRMIQERFAFLHYPLDAEQEKSRLEPIMKDRTAYLAAWLDSVRAHINAHRPDLVLSQRSAVGMAHEITRVPRSLSSDDAILEAYVWRGLDKTVKDAILSACPVNPKIFAGRS